MSVNVLTYPGLERRDYTRSGPVVTQPSRLVSVLALAVATSGVALPAWAGAPSPPALADARAARARSTLSTTPAAKPADACVGLRLAPEARTPFAPGEELIYDLSVSGLYLGKVELKVGRPRVIDGRRTESFFGRARTSGFASALKSFAGRYMTVVEPELYHPVELRSEATYGEDARQEAARFTRDFRELRTTYRTLGKTAQRSYSRDAPVYDMLTLLYHSRRLPLKPGATLCQEVYADKRLWRADAQVVGVEQLATPMGDKAVLKVATQWKRLPHPDFNPKNEPPWFDVDIYYTNDTYRAPVAFVARTKDFTARGDLVRWATADRATEASGWDF